MISIAKTTKNSLNAIFPFKSSILFVHLNGNNLYSLFSFSNLCFLIVIFNVE